MIGHELGLAGSYSGMGIHILHERSEPPGGDLHIRVEQYGILGINLPESLVVAIGKAVVLTEGDGLHRGELRGEQGQ